MKGRLVESSGDMSPDQLECYKLLADCFGGEHHLEPVYIHGRGLRTSSWGGKLATFDFDYLTRLVLLAHERCIRIEIVQGGPNRVGIVAHKRHAREGDMAVRHPTIDQAIVRLGGRREAAGLAQRLREVAVMLRTSGLLDADAATDCDNAARLLEGAS